MVELSKTHDCMLDILRNPNSALDIDEKEWDGLFRLLRFSRLLARVGVRVEQAGISDRLPKKVVDHLSASRAMADYFQRMLLWELNRIQRALSKLSIPIVVLKGGAYIIEKLPPRCGRFVSDLDLLVEKRNIPLVEKTLLEAGWMTAKLDPYDQRYYRQWMHEIPPLRHKNRGFEVDLHHTIIPITSRLKPDANLLMNDADPVRGRSVKVLGACDMVLHSATHLFYDSDLERGLRDLVDLDDLLRHFSSKNREFWKDLLDRAEVMNLQRPLFYTLRYAFRYLETPVPEKTRNRAVQFGPNKLTLNLMDWLVARTIFPEHPDFPSKSTAIARWLLYVRSHYLRMPLYLLIPHLLRKSIRRQNLIPAMAKFKKDTTAAN